MPTDDLCDLMEWSRFAEGRKTLLEALTILNNRHREVVAMLNQRLIDRTADMLAKVVELEMSNRTLKNTLIASEAYQSGLVADIEAMREAIKGANDALSKCEQVIGLPKTYEWADEEDCDAAYDLANAALAKLKPFLP